MYVIETVKAIQY